MLRFLIQVKISTLLKSIEFSSCLLVKFAYFFFFVKAACFAISFLFVYICKQIFSLVKNVHKSKTKSCCNVKPSVYFLCEKGYIYRFLNLH